MVRTALVLALLVAVASPAQAADLDTVVDGLQAFYEKTDSFKARFTQVVRKQFRPGGQASTPRTGTAYFLKPGKMRWDYEAPDQVYYISDGETLWIYEVAQSAAYKGQVKGSRLYDSMKFLFGTAQLREEFTMTLGPEADGKVELELVPKSGQQAYKKLVLLVDLESFEIRESRLVDPAGDVSVITFDEVQYARIDNPEWFEWTPGEGVRVMDLDKQGQP
jgi:outer membrane lipoprotein carrier protein